MAEKATVKYPQIGVCGLSCRLCPRYHVTTSSRCEGCKTPSRLGAPCPISSCALKRQTVEFCWDCAGNRDCTRWAKLRTFSKEHDSPKCYQSVENDISLVARKGIVEFDRLQKDRERLLARMLAGFNEGRSKSYYCIAVTVMTIPELLSALRTAEQSAAEVGEIKERAAVLHSILDCIAVEKGYLLKLRK